jgi:hypothetical protein
MAVKSVPKTYQSSYSVAYTSPEAGYTLLESSFHSGKYDWTDVKSGVSVHAWKEKIKRNSDATSPYSVVSKEISDSPGSVTFVRTGFYFGNPYTHTEILKGVFAPVIPPTEGFDGLVNDVVNSATIEFLLKARKIQTKFRGLTFVGELGEAIRMVRQNARNVQRLIRSNLHAYKRGARVPKPQRRKWVRERWLELQFGWLPVLSDAEDAAKALAEANGKFRRSVEPVRFFKDVEIPYGPLTENPSYTPSGSGIFCYLHARQKLRVLVSTVGAVGVTDFSDVGGFDSDLWGFSPREFVPTLWELIPWSWAIDYFSNVGKVLDCWSFGLSNLYWSSQTVKVEAECLATCTPNPAALQATWGSLFLGCSGSSASTRVTSFSLARNKLSKLPDFRWDISFPGWRRVANLAAALSLNREVVSLLQH